jgi:hypothetical protein
MAILAIQEKLQREADLERSHYVVYGRAMTDGEARMLLNSAWLPGIGNPGGVGRASWWAEALEAAAGDRLDALVAWIEGKGGGRGTVAPVKSNPTVGRVRQTPTKDYFYVPREALNP